MAKRKKRKGGRRRRRQSHPVQHVSHGGGGGHRRRGHGRRRSKRGMPGWLIFGGELLAGALVGSILGPLFPEAISGEAVVLGGLAVADKHRRALLGVSAVAMEGLMLASHSKPVQEATARVAKVSEDLKAKLASAKGGGGGKGESITVGGTVSSIKGAVNTAKQLAPLAAVAGL